MLLNRLEAHWSSINKFLSCSNKYHSITDGLFVYTMTPLMVAIATDSCICPDEDYHHQTDSSNETHNFKHDQIYIVKIPSSQN